ncbi:MULTISPECIES: TetR/AcrR family transcriptional regulator [unclassified Rathayibacter]|uniref:TetR/AcrR family transcriptional regulator n=1 Tax=unclassified Rathayibacter TaxID=2609250 RepID=UPI001FB4A1C2|nr:MULTISPECIES: TetR/AcrR family transcriptional regulator [unclassified Rathayibacter]MCJ1673391.1 TetR/AcrR family transcriptional regulator [Rathayibacter sp. VKM Ac-2929]MCJ1682861.1 TetR/AcrR family transcriptional regulator [Rathayibacter sp. VKM Ac-2928]MCJ1687605.1 TetR/AcrR family transcriptional regulator [Rathayibacter sp. VKM Ac-2927]
MTEHRSGPVRSAAARESVLEATARLFLQRGWDHLTMEGIAKDAGVSKQTVYRWWPSRGALIADCMIEGRLVAIEVQLPDTGDLRRDLGVWLAPILELAGTEPGASLVRSLIAAGAEDAAVGERLGRAFGVDQTLSDRFAKAVEAGQLPADAPVDELGLSILGAIILPVVGRRPLVAASVLGHVDFLLRPRG